METDELIHLVTQLQAVQEATDRRDHDKAIGEAISLIGKQATRIAELEGALRDLLAEDDGEPADETGGACLYVHGDDLLSARRVLGEGSAK